MIITKRNKASETILINCFQIFTFFGGFLTAPMEDLVNINKSYINDPMIVFYAFTQRVLVEKPDFALLLLSQFYRSC